MKILAVVAILALMSAAAWADELAGQYALEHVREVGSELLLKPDGTFEYMLAYGAADYTAEGTWKRDRDSVVLNTQGKAQPPFKLLKSASTPSDPPAIRVWVKTPDGRPVEHIRVLLKTAQGESEQTTTRDEPAMFEPTAAPQSVRLQVRVYRVDAGPFVLNPAHNEFQFEINGEAITQVRFENERLKINGNALELRFWDKDKAMVYRRQ